MESQIRYRGRVVTGQDIALIRNLISEHPGANRRVLSQELCRAWGWVQPNGVLRDMVCRGLLLELNRGGHIELPPPMYSRPVLHRKTPSQIEVDQTPVEGSVSDLGPLEFRQVRRTPSEILFNSLIAHHHYLGYCQPVGEHLKYLVYANNREIACLAWSSAPRHIGDRDRFIGWTKDDRKKNLSLIACNTRFLILPWVKVVCLASHILGKMARIVPKDWERIYRHPLHYLETFIDQERFGGTCYRAANWIRLGQTTGRGKNDQTGKANRSRKAILGYPLSKDFRAHLCGGQG